MRIFAPPMNALLSVELNGEIVPSQYALDIKRAGLKIITWTFERSDLRKAHVISLDGTWREEDGELASPHARGARHALPGPGRHRRASGAT